MNERQVEDLRKLTRGYAGFQMATALLVAQKVGDIHGGALAVTLLAFSIPVTLFATGLYRVTPNNQNRKTTFEDICIALVLVPSIAAFSILLAAATKWAGVTFAVSCVVWMAVIKVVQNRNRRKPSRNPPPD